MVFIILIRKATDDDIKAIKNILDRNFDEVLINYHSKEILTKFKEENTQESIRLQLGWKKVYVAVFENEIVGSGAFANFGTKEKPKYSVSNLYILPEMQKRGVGKLILNMLLSDFIETGESEFFVPSSRNAVGFYQRMGFLVNDIQDDTEDEITWMTYKLF